MTIKTIVLAVVTLAESWLPNDSLVNDIKDAILALLNIKTLIKSPLADVAYNVATQAENAMHDLETSGYAIAGGTSIAGKHYSLVIVENGSAVAQNFGI